MADNTILERAQEYIKAEKDNYFRKQVEELVYKNNTEELNDRFYTSLAFGTGGLRGVIGGGFNRMNPFTVQRATQGLANYMLKQSGISNPSAVIAYDNRHYSAQFALETAKVFCGNGIKTYLFSKLRPTPELSFAIRYLGATTGIVITASHNPPEYNGYKAYWSDGCQILPPHDTAIVEEAAQVTTIHAMDRDEAIAKKLLIMVDAVVDEAYSSMVKSLTVRPQLIKEKGRLLKIVYTPLHGTGSELVPKVLYDMGIPVICVDEQMINDGAFPTVASPNPEEPAALKMAIEKAIKVNADIVMATDPDADRLGVAVLGSKGFELISGNQLGALLADYILSGMKEMKTLPPKPALIKTIVTTELQRKIADKYHTTCFDVLTGFKYIGGMIREFETSENKYDYIVGGEESYGYLIGTKVRDKDAVSAAVMTAEMALYYKQLGKTLLDQLNVLYQEFGYYQEILINKTFKGEAGVLKIKTLMDTLRANPPKELGGQPVEKIKDYLDGTEYTVKRKSRKKTISLPASNVLQFILKDSSIVSVRPSGTEPKIKFYASCFGLPGKDLAKAKETVQNTIETIRKEINNLVSE